MKISSLGFQTNLMLARYSGTVEDKASYVLVKTPDNPTYHWGNYIIFDKAPKPGDFKNWTEIFENEFPYYEELNHYLFAWGNQTQQQNYQEFLDANFDFDKAAVLTTAKLNPPKNLNTEVKIRPLNSQLDWLSAIELQIRCANTKYLNSDYRSFKEKQMHQYKKISAAGKGFWFGAFLGKQLVGNLGIFHEDGIGRFQSVGTDPDFRRKGICGTLVYHSGSFMMQGFGVKKLVMEADPDYHAARIYESVGFVKSEENYSLSWWKGKK